MNKYKKTGRRIISIVLFLVMCVSWGMTGNAAAKKFVDVSKGAWYYDAVMDVAEKGIFNGTDSTHFSPDQSLTRAMFVTVLWRYHGEPSGYKNVFSDVDSGSWYGKAVAWANSAGVVTGTSSTTFAPDANITREQMAAIMYRYANYIKVSTSGRDNLSSYSDRGAVSSYAKEPVQWSVKMDLLYCSGGKLRPQATATRAEAAYMLSNFSKKFSGDGDGGAGSEDSDKPDTSGGKDGKSAYELAVENGYKGTVQQWLASLAGKDGKDGKNGKDGASAYEIAVKNGYQGTEVEWIRSLAGQPGKSAYQVALDNGFEGTEPEWLASLKGEPGKPGESAYEIAVKNGFEGTEPEWLESLQASGRVGASAYEVAQKNGFEGSETQWLASLKGSEGPQGKAGVGIRNAYVNSELHLILEMTDDSTIDAGYVGVSVGDIVTNYTVTFVDYNGVVLKSQNVEEGGSAEAPEVPEREGYTFIGWDKAYSNVTGHLTVTAVYKDNTVTTYTVEFKDFDGATIDIQEVREGKEAILPDAPVRSGYYFAGWDKSWKAISQAEEIQAVYVEENAKNIFTVSGESGTAGSEVTVSVALNGTVQLCGYDLDLHFDSSMLELVDYDAEISMDVVVGTSGAENGLIQLNYSNQKDRVRTGGVVDLTFRIKEDAAGAAEISLSVENANSVICLDPENEDAFTPAEHSLCKGYVKVV